MMSRIGKTFRTLRSRHEKALIPYIMAGDPSLKTTDDLVLALEKSGADMIELGVPFSDPIADGPVIQRAGQRALQRRTSLIDILGMVRDLRFKTEIPLILMTYANPVFRLGVQNFIHSAVSSGVDGVILPDVPLEEGKSIMTLAAEEGLDVILLAAPTTPRSRLVRIVQSTHGFLYYVSLTGITGAKLKQLQEIKSRLHQIRRLTDKPISVGFGISTPEQAASLARAADGIVVGSAIVRLIEENADQPDLIRIVGDFVRSMKKALAPSRSKSH